jgi:glucose/arabinose dehydrogenase
MKQHRIHRSSSRSGVAALLAAAMSVSCSARAQTTPAPTPATTLAAEVVVSGLQDPVYLTAPAGDARLFVVEQPGRVRVVRGGRLLDRPFLDLTADVSYGGERGLLGLAFHPRYRENGLFYVNYTDPAGDTRIERFRVTADPNLADPSSRKRILEIEQPYANHNGGHVLFGPDGMLYIGMGDGGSAGDPHGNSQNRRTLLGDLLRIDVDRGEPYAIPPDNPYVGTGYRGEIWAYGLRNPWRFCFDPPEGKLYIADVGQNRWEEIHVEDSKRSGLNYGWNRMEGAHCYGARECDPRGLAIPVLEYDHSQGCSVTGGFVYRGRALPGLAGHYFHADYCTGWVRSFRLSGGRVTSHREWRLGRLGNITSFGLDAAGELYVCSGNGRVYRLVPARARS